ncbi:MAG: NAD(P)/FAD-dependent oxidoreductase [Promethearchaeota archaeon]|nr:MAG: NAD(P)/FAD-dependent oxidoreductase [Candidatus Lokiarchaeota archaeon]
MNNYDLIIVGAGPGGSMAAKTAAEKGLKTIFFERGRKPGEKNSSGCGLGPRMFRDFPKLMRNLTPDKCPSMRAGTASRNYFINKDDIVAGYIMARPTESVSYEPAKSWITMNVYRSEFDPWIAEFATNAGAELKISTLIVDLLKEDGKVCGVIDEKGEKYNAPLVIGADGVISMVAEKSGLRNKWAQNQITLVPQYDFQASSKKIDDIMGDETLGIWWGSTFPASYQVFFNDGFHQGLGNWMNWWDKNPLYYLNRVINLKYYQRLLRNLDATPRELQAHLLPWLDYPYNTYTDGVILIGDAGGFPCPLEAEGIYPAMVTGKIASEVASDLIPSGELSKVNLKKFDEKWQKTSIGKEFESGYELWNIWKALPFSPKETMSWFVPMIMEILGGIFDWSQPHALRVRQIIGHVRSYMPKATPFIMTYVIPLLTKVFEDDLDKLMDPKKIMKILPKLLDMLPQKKKKRGA